MFMQSAAAAVALRCDATAVAAVRRCVPHGKNCCRFNASEQAAFAPSHLQSVLSPACSLGFTCGVPFFSLFLFSAV